MLSSDAATSPETAALVLVGREIPEKSQNSS